VSEFLPDILVRYGDDLLDGFLITLQLVFFSVAIGALFAMVIAYWRMPGAGREARNPLLRHVLYPFFRGLAWFYTAFFRGTPLLAQLFLIYYGAGQFFRFWQDVGLWWFLREPFNCALLAFILNTAAYQAEIFRGAVRAVPRGQWEGAAALGLTRRIAFLRVVAPQASLYALRPFGNEIILMVKGSAIASVVTVYDLLGETRLAFSDTFRFEVYFYAAALYLVLVETLRRIWNLLESRLTRHLRTDVDRPATVRGQVAVT
jgi:polar amino acid transport system permease protein